MSSLLVNSSAMSALQTLAATQKSLATTQARISSGLKVASASDNAAYWSISTTMQSDNQALSAVSDALNLGSSTVDVANAGLKSEIGLLNQMKSDLVTAQAPGADKTKVQTDISALQAQMKSIADGASFSGENWLSVNSGATGYNATKSVVASFTRTSAGVSVGTIDVDTSTIKLYDSTGNTGLLDKTRTGTGGTTGAISSISIDNTTTQTAMSDYLSMVDSALTDVTTAATNLGADKTRIGLQQSFVSSLMDAVTQGVGSLVNADMNTESTKLQALQVQQQLGVQSLSIANQNSQMILKLFGG